MPTLTSDQRIMERQRKLKQFLQEEALANGFDVIAITKPDAIPMAPARLHEFIDNDYHADMVWMKETQERRSNPKKLWEDVQSVIMLGMNYGPDIDPRSIHEHPDRAAISVYAQNRDYHDIIKGKLKQIAGRFVARAGGNVKVFVDTAPVMEKPLAEAAGLGWQGKHTNLVSREFGSWLFLGSIFTSVALEADQPDKNRCGSCHACLTACPTNAFPAPYKIDARRCISYLTIENKGPIPEEFRKSMGNRIYGCDDCLAVCPWNKFAVTAQEIKLQARDDLKSPELKDLLLLDDATFRTFFSGSPVKRIGRNRFMRNVLIAAGNSGLKELMPLITPHLTDEDPLVRGSAVWAIKQIITPADFSHMRSKLLPAEKDQSVIMEWDG